MVILSSKTYVKILFLLIGVVLTSTVTYAYYFSQEYPLPFTSRISFDAKIQFVRDKIDVEKIDTIIVGSSIGLNNVNGVALEEASKRAKHVLNLSVYESSPVQVEQMLQLIDIFPNLKRIVYSAQFSDFQHASSFRDYQPKWIGLYMAKKLTPVAEAKFLLEASKDLAFLQKRKNEWHQKHGQSNKFTYLGFDRTGSVPLEIYGKDIIPSRWNNPHGTLYVQQAFAALDRMTKLASKKGIVFYMVQQPYRPELVQKHAHVLLNLKIFLDRLHKIVPKNGGYILSLFQTLPLEDTYFADRSHLNAKGSVLAAQAIAKFIDETEKEK